MMTHLAQAEAGPAKPETGLRPKAPAERAQFVGERPSREVRRVADWIVASSDNHHLPFAIVDKANARLFVFNPSGRIKGASAVLLGSARGDHSAPGVGERRVAEIPPRDRTTPAGRFVAERGRNLEGEDIIWIDYDAALSIHRVRPTALPGGRVGRLATVTPADNRISYGCVNVPARFYNDVVDRTFKSTRGIVYVLPEVRSVGEVFGMHSVSTRTPRHSRKPPAF
jgi:hypothetical protein